MPGPLSQLQRYIPPQVQPQQPMPVAAPSRFLEQSGAVTMPVEAPMVGGPPVPQEIAMAPLSLPVNPDGGTPTPDGFAPVFDDIAQNNMDPTPDKDRSFKGKLLRGLQAIAPLLSGAASGMAIGGTSPNAAAAAGNAFNQMAVIQPMEQARLEMDREKHAYDLLKSEYDIKKTQADIGKTEEETRLMDPTFQMKLDAARSNSEYQMAQKALAEARAETENLLRKANLEGKQLANKSTEAQIVLRKAQAKIQEQLVAAGWGEIRAAAESQRIMQSMAQTSYMHARMDEMPARLGIAQQNAATGRMNAENSALNTDISLIAKLEALTGGGDGKVSDATRRFIQSQLQEAASYSDNPADIRAVQEELARFFPEAESLIFPNGR